jgi:CDP-diacylglycerol--glycerol-3-phosphate 3-phosphatidyltransferase
MKAGTTQQASTYQKGSRWAASLYWWKPAFATKLLPIRDRLAAFGVQPNQLTLAAIPLQFGIALALIGGSFIPLVWLVIGPLALLLMTVNAIDGSLARQTQTSTVWGAVANELVDRTGDIIIFAAAFAVAPMWVAAAAFATVCLTELFAAVSWAITGERSFLGPMGKPDRMLVLGVGGAIAVLWAPALPTSLTIIAVGAGIGAANRARTALSAANILDERRHDR